MNQLTFKLQVFEGPLDLLLHLLQKNKVNICDIPISLITDQYFEYIEQMRVLDLEVTGEFIVMASQLLLIKSKMLLPRPEEEEEEDPRAELVDRLLEYQRIRNAAEFFSHNQNSAQLLYFKQPGHIELPKQRAFNGEIPLTELVKAFNDILERKQRLLPPRKEVFSNIVKRETVSVRLCIRNLRNLLVERKSMPLDEIFANIHSRPEAVSTFLAVLELIRSGKMAAVYRKGKIICTLVGDDIEPERSTGSD